MITLGIGDQTHDPSVAIAKDGMIIAAIELERLTRLKHNLKVDTAQYSIQRMGEHFETMCKKLDKNTRENLLQTAIDYCLEAANITEAQIHCLVQSTLFEAGCFPYRSVFINHHLAHAASAFYASPFENSAVLTLDGYGSSVDHDTYETGTWGIGNHNTITVAHNYTGKFNLDDEEKKAGVKNTIIVLENSLGAFYKNVTVLAGMGHFGEGKTMGLSSYGYDNAKFRQMREHVELLPNGEFKIDNRSIFEALEKLIFAAKQSLSADKFFKFRADMAHEAQKILEEVVIHICHHIYAETKLDNLCFAGGVALNGLLNEKILHATPFKQLFIQPAASDNGIALGCAYYGYYMIKGGTRNLKKNTCFSPYLGKNYDSELSNFNLKPYKEKITEIKIDSSLPAYIADLIAQGRIIGWFNGSCEIGPRALGNRSILSDPRNLELKNHLNLEIKKREGFRPFAPVVLEEFTSDFFETDSVSPYMLRVIKVKKSAAPLIPAVVHVDGTARIQTINEQQNKLYYEIISEFNKLTGVPMVLNTSFNGNNEPIVESPKDAIESFIALGLDVLVLNSRIFFNSSKFAVGKNRGNPDTAAKKNTVTGELI